MSKYTLIITKTEQGFGVDEKVEGEMSLFEIIGMLNHLQLQKGLELNQKVTEELNQQNEKG